MNYLNKVKCEKCGKGVKEALIARYNDLWLCGECLEDYQKKLREINKKLILEG